MRVVICGAGVIGATLAYFLARRGAQVTVIERTGVANAASGKSGGFLALDWCDTYELRDLARRSFALHGELAAELDGAAWGYRPLTTYAGHARAIGREHAPGLPWLGGAVDLDGRLGGPETTAQVHPALFTQAMLQAAQSHGATLVMGEVTGLLLHDGRAVGAELGERSVPGDAVVIAMGPWSVLAARWLDFPAVYGLKGHSLVFDTTLPADSLFCEFQEADGAVHSPEVMPRPDGTTYVCAISSESPLPVDPAAVAPDEGAMDRLAAICRRIAPALTADRILARQACFRPVTRDGLPLIGPLGVPGAWVAAGHSVWGMLNAPATAEAMTELLLDGNSTLDLSAFDPQRLPPARL